MTKPFDLGAAKAGAPVQTRDGRKVRLLCFDRIDPVRSGHIVGLIEKAEGGEFVEYWNDLGECYCYSGATLPTDLVMTPVKRSRKEWVNVYQDYSVGYPTQDMADRHTLARRLACIPVTLEWEE